MTPEERAKKIMEILNPNNSQETIEWFIVTNIKEAMKDQRHACAEAVNAMEAKSHNFAGPVCIHKDATYQAVFNARTE